MDVDDLDLPPGICATLNSEKRTHSILRESVSSVTNVNKTDYISDWIQNCPVSSSTIKTYDFSSPPEKPATKLHDIKLGKASSKSSNSSYLSQPSISNKSNKSNKINQKNHSEVNLCPAGSEGSFLQKNKNKAISLSNSIKSKDSFLVDNLEIDKMNSNTKCTRVINEPDEEWAKIFKSQEETFNKMPLNTNNENFKKHMKRAVGLCSCKKCETDIPHELTWNNPEFERKHPQERQQPRPFLKTDGSLIATVTTAPIGHSRSMESNKSVVLTHGVIVHLPQWEINKTNLHIKVQEWLTALGYERSKPVQAYGWAEILRGHNAMLTHGPQTGKTMTYMAALSSCLLDPERYEHIPSTGRSPVLIILANDASVAIEVYRKLEALMRHHPLHHNIWLPLLPLSGKKIAQFFNTKVPDMSSKKRQLKAIQLDILITTVDTLIVLLNDRVIDLKRLRHFVVENVNVVLEKIPKRFEMILGAIESMLSHRNSYDSVQFISTGEKWTKKVEALAVRLHTFPTIIIGNPMQAALYGRAQLQLKFVENEGIKSELLAELLENVKYYIYKCIVICKSDEICVIEEQFCTRSINFVTASDNIHGAQIVDVIMSWKTTPNGKHIVLICTDKAFREHIRVSNASFLVNYSLPPTWSMFSKRFSTLIDSYLCPLTSTFTENKFNCQVVTYVDRNSLDRCARIANFFQVNGLKVPDAMLQYCKEKTLKEEQEKITANVQLCRRLLTLGTCKDPVCKHRHTIAKLQENAMRSPANGLITCRLAHMRSTNHYFLQILAVKDLQGVVHKYPDYATQVLDFLNDATGFEMAINVLQGSVYLYMDGKQFHRCRVQRVDKYVSIGDTMTENPLEVEIFGLDNGVNRIINVDKLYVLPKELEVIPQSVVEVYVANIVPPFKESRWTPNADRMLSEKLRTFKKTAVYRGSILLRLNDILWLDDLEVRQMEGPFMNRMLLSQWLKQKYIYEECNEPLQNLYQLCKNGGISLPEYKILEEDSERKPKIIQAEASWAHLSSDELNAVYFASATSSECLYVKHSKFNPLLKNLEESISHSRLLKRRLAANEVIVGHYYCSKDEISGDWCRTLIVEVKDKIATCFFVDYGDYQFVDVDSLRPLANEHLTRLPCQAIECSLYGVTASNSTDVVDKLYELCYEPGSDFYKTWYACCVSTELQATHGTGKKYKIVLFESDINTKVSMNSILLADKLAEGATDESLDSIELPECKSDGSDDDCMSYERLSGEIEPDFNADDWDVIVGDVVFTSEQANFREQSTEGVATTTTNGEGYVPMVAAPKDEKLLPKINWYQTATHVFMEFMFIENRDYKINIVRNRFLSFNTCYKGENYSMTMNLFSTVSKQFTHECKTHFISVVVEKVKEEDWPRLVKSETKMVNIKYKTDRIEISDSDEEREEDCVLQSKDIDDKYFKNAVLTSDGVIEEFYSDYEDSDSDYGDGLEDY